MPKDKEHQLAPSRFHQVLTNLNRPLSNQRGVALLMALFATSLMMILAVELTYDTNVDYQIASQQLNRLKAYYAARAGMEMGLLRIKIFQQIGGAVRKLDKQTRSAIPMGMVDSIWQMPFVWPPPVGEALSTVDRDNIEKSTTESLMEAQYAIQIKALSGKIDLNDLGSPSSYLRNSTRLQLLAALQARVESDEELSRQYRGFRFEEIINNITDWVDEDQASLNGGDERNHYQNVPSGVRFLPPNQPFRHISELHMVPKMTDQLFDLITEMADIHGIKGINVNYCNQNQLLDLHPRMTPEIATEIIKRRENPGPFVDQEDFLTFMRSKGLDTRIFEGDEAVPLYFDPEFLFQITSTGTFGKSSREIVAVVYDFDRVRENLGNALKRDQQNSGANAGGAGTPNGQDGQGTGQSNTNQGTGNNPAAGTSPAGNHQAARPRPNVVYWQED
jgi:general secretion pathway protein K